MANWTNPETGRTIRVYVHSSYECDGDVWLKVNKGDDKSNAVFSVLCKDTDFVPMASVFA